MKTKKLSKKLVLSKETVANLFNQEMNAVHGGATQLTICTCPTRYPLSCDTVCAKCM